MLIPSTRTFEDRALRWLGGQVVIIANIEETEGSCFAIMSVVPEAAHSPLHIHDEDDELLYVLSGAVAVQTGERWVTYAAGESIPPIRHGEAHAVKNVHHGETVVLTISVPGRSLAEFFGSLSARAELAAEPEVRSQTGSRI